VCIKKVTEVCCELNLLDGKVLAELAVSLVRTIPGEEKCTKSMCESVIRNHNNFYLKDFSFFTPMFKKQDLLKKKETLRKAVQELNQQLADMEKEEELRNSISTFEEAFGKTERRPKPRPAPERAGKAETRPAEKPKAKVARPANKPKTSEKERARLLAMLRSPERSLGDYALAWLSTSRDMGYKDARNTLHLVCGFREGSLLGMFKDDRCRFLVTVEKEELQKYMQSPRHGDCVVVAPLLEEEVKGKLSSVVGLAVGGLSNKQCRAGKRVLLSHLQELVSAGRVEDLVAEVVLARAPDGGGAGPR
jgi:hypothetical protein